MLLNFLSSVLLNPFQHLQLHPRLLKNLSQVLSVRVTPPLPMGVAS